MAASIPSSVQSHRRWVVRPICQRVAGSRHSSLYKRKMAWFTGSLPRIHMAGLPKKPWFFMRGSARLISHSSNIKVCTPNTPASTKKKFSPDCCISAAVPAKPLISQKAVAASSSQPNRLLMCARLSCSLWSLSIISARRMNLASALPSAWRRASVIGSGSAAKIWPRSCSRRTSSANRRSVVCMVFCGEIEWRDFSISAAVGSI